LRTVQASSFSSVPLISGNLTGVLTGLVNTTESASLAIVP
jgi:hypothetical protein